MRLFDKPYSIQFGLYTRNVHTLVFHCVNSLWRFVACFESNETETRECKPRDKSLQSYI